MAQVGNLFGLQQAISLIRILITGTLGFQGLWGNQGMQPSCRLFHFRWPVTGHCGKD